MSTQWPTKVLYNMKMLSHLNQRKVRNFQHKQGPDTQLDIYLEKPHKITAISI
jgi:hypothetical protein